MARKLFLLTVPVFLSVVCFMNCKTTNKATVATERKFEGYIFLESRAYTGADQYGMPLNEVTGNDSIMITITRRMFLLDESMISVIKSNIVHDGVYIRSDTIGYYYNNFSLQRFAQFNILTPDAELTKKGNMADTGGYFSNTAAFDPMNEIPDSIWRVTDTVINGDSIGIVNFIIPVGSDSLTTELLKRSKFWVNYEIRDFPLQLSYILSKKLRNGFVYKMQLSDGDGSFMLVTSLNYQPAKLSDSLVKIFENWTRKALE